MSNQQIVQTLQMNGFTAKVFGAHVKVYTDAAGWVRFEAWLIQSI